MSPGARYDPNAGNGRPITSRNHFSPGMMIGKFAATALFALMFLDLPLMYFCMRSVDLLQMTGFWILLTVIPLVAGVLGIFWFHQILGGIQWFIERLLGVPRT